MLNGFGQGHYTGDLLLSILVPVYNERTVVERSLAQVLAAPLPEKMERELIVVDDCSTDGTSVILQRLAQENPCIRLFQKTKNEGKGAAVAMGWEGVELARAAVGAVAVCEFDSLH